MGTAAFTSTPLAVLAGMAMSNPGRTVNEYVATRTAGPGAFSATTR
jgi:hypothetical protein